MTWWQWILVGVGCAGVMVIMAKIWARQIVQVAINREKYEQSIARSKKEEEERAANQKRQINSDLAKDDAAIDAMTPEETERKLNE